MGLYVGGVELSFSVCLLLFLSSFVRESLMTESKIFFAQQRCDGLTSPSVDIILPYREQIIEQQPAYHL